eukprot:3671727-Pleurochrysis_carterae.AAC.1
MRHYRVSRVASASCVACSQAPRATAPARTLPRAQVNLNAARVRQPASELNAPAYARVIAL